MRERALLPVSTYIWTPTPAAPIKHLGQTAEGFESECLSMKPLCSSMCIHSMCACWFSMTIKMKGAGKYVRLSAHALHIRAWVCMHCLQYIYEDLLAPIDCECASRVMEREGEKTRTLWIGLKTDSQTGRTKDGRGTASRKMDECMNIHWC